MKITDIFDRLDKFPQEEVVFLECNNCFQLLIGVILSAQTTDRQVNLVLPKLFMQYPTPEALSIADTDAVSKVIHSVGFYNTKAKNIIKTAEIIHKQHNDKVPSNMDELLKLSGVGRKSANVIRGACFNLPAVIVDTHFSRVVFRLGLTKAKNADLIEKEIALQTPIEIQYRFSMLINKHGRTICKAKNPLCSKCPLFDVCELQKNKP